MTVSIRAGLLALLLPLAAWAQGTDSPISVTEGGSRVVAVSAGWLHSCGLKADGSVECWGLNNAGQLGLPIGDGTYFQPGPYLSVAAGGFHSCGLKADGSVDCWGSNSNGQATDQPGPYLSVSVGHTYSCGLEADGSVDCWGGYGADYGQVADQAGPYLSVAAGVYHTCALKADGSVDCWGDNGQGQLGDTRGDGTHGKPGPYLSVAASQYHTCGLKADGSVDCWGANFQGQATDQPGPYLSVSAGWYHSCGLKADGSVHCWGGIDFDYGQVEDQPGPYLSVSAGEYHNCGLKADGRVDCWGAGAPGTSGSNNYGQSTVPVALQAVGRAGFGQIAAGNAHACDLKRDGTITCWGDNSEGQTDAPAGLFTQVVAGSGYSCAIRADGTASCWGRSSSTFLNAVLDDYGPYRQLALGTQHAVCALAAGTGQGQESLCVNEGVGDHSDGISARNITSDYSSSLAQSASSSLCAVAADGGGYCRTVSGAVSPADEAIPEGRWQRLESGLNHQCGLKADSSIECWGNNLIDGQLSNLPASTEKFRVLSVGYNHACAIRTNGQLACWGSNVNGQATPPTGTFVQVAAGNTFTCGIRDNGIRVCWGAGAGVAVTLLPGTLPNGIAGTAYANQQFSLSGDAANLPANPVYAVSSGSLPDGLSLTTGLNLTAGGWLSGTPTMAGTFTFSVDVEGEGDFGATQSYTVTIIADSTPPTIDYTLTSVSPGSNGWYRGDITVTWSVTDPDSAATIDSGCGTGLVDTLNADTAPAGVAFSCSAHSAGGSASKTTSVLKRDATNPTISIAPASPANASGWYNADVSVLASCSDPSPGSGVASCPSVPNVTSEGTTTVPPQTVQDNAGNSGSSNTLTIKLDKTAPTINAAATTTPNANGWYSGNVTIHFTCSDATSGVAGTCPTDQVLTASGSSTTQTIFDNAGNSATSNAVTVQIDKSAPMVGYAFAPPAPDGNNGWYRGNVDIDWTATDPDSGIASDCADTTLATDTAGASWTCTATNGAGLQTSVTTSTIKRDSTAPTLAPTTPSPLLRGQSYSASPNAADVLSGIATSSCGALDTSTLGSKSTTCSATDNAGNSKTVTLDYTVSTTCANDGYKGTQLTWCRNICENGLTGATLDTWIHRWISRYRDLPYCRVAPPQPN